MNIVGAAGGVVGLSKQRLHLALYPSIINGIVFGNRKYLAPNPWGPVVNATDIIAAGARQAYAKAGFQVTYMDDWYDHHVLMGEVHCGTNVARDASDKW
ncbi:protein-arginine deiminase type-3 [Moelleriella libera RCEF 2490]|uniref:Protein-arginine deiminase type-3 n=1 Tax=Moelleriella libera RCEF 2490 TaxID=1081109 RepID=A0A166U637_9HYPO|nr:protein-arginine deiminase type-3 [Moelleriella libera RCEF 2490]